VKDHQVHQQSRQVVNEREGFTIREGECESSLPGPFKSKQNKAKQKKTVAAVGISARGGWDNATVGEKRVFWMSGRVKVAGSEAGDAINISALGSLKH
jgi:hypothetical protein